MKNKNGVRVIGVLLLFTACYSPGNKPTLQQPEIPGPLKILDKGKRIFGDKCIVCHGADGAAGIANAADLRISTLDTVSILRTITHGKGSMPAFADQLGTGEIEQVANYVFSLRNKQTSQ